MYPAYSTTSEISYEYNTTIDSVTYYYSADSVNNITQINIDDFMGSRTVTNGNSDPPDAAAIYTGREPGKTRPGELRVSGTRYYLVISSPNDALNVANNMLKFLNSGVLTTSYTNIYLSSFKEDVNDRFGQNGAWVKTEGRKSYVYTWQLKTDDGGINWYFPTPTSSGGFAGSWSDESTHSGRAVRFSIDYLENDGDGSYEHKLLKILLLVLDGTNTNHPIEHS